MSGRSAITSMLQLSLLVGLLAATVAARYDLPPLTPPTPVHVAGSSTTRELAYLAPVKPPLATGDEVSVRATFESPVTVHVATKTHAWFSALLSPGTGPLVVICSLAGDGTTAKCNGTCAGSPVPNGCPSRDNSSAPTSCTMTKLSTDNGKSWGVLPGWEGANELLPLGTNGTFVTLPYSVNIDVKTNRTAASTNSYGRMDSAGMYTKGASLQMLFLVGDDPRFRGLQWPGRLVHSGSVVKLKDGSHLTTMYGHGLGAYRHWSQHSAVYFVRSTDAGRVWSLRSVIPWQPAYGAAADGPGEPSTARLPDGTLWVVFRSDSTQYYWSAVSTDEGVSWSNAAKLPFAWSVKPRLRVTTKGVLVLTGGRPGIDLWASNDKGKSWSRFNIAAEHNTLMKAAGADGSLLFDEQVIQHTCVAMRTLPPPPCLHCYHRACVTTTVLTLLPWQPLCVRCYSGRQRLVAFPAPRAARAPDIKLYGVGGSRGRCNSGELRPPRKWLERPRLGEERQPGGGVLGQRGRSVHDANSPRLGFWF